MRDGTDGDETGQNGPTQAGTDQTGAPWQLADALGRGAVVLVFYRGDW
ncbi:MAG: hypothetical protein WKF80_04485 [Thermomicrobiales bacterium]